MPLPSLRPRPPTRQPGDGLQQAKDYAEILGLTFAYSTNGHEHRRVRLLDRPRTQLEDFPTPDELWARRLDRENLDPTPRRAAPHTGQSQPGKAPRYYQEIAINRTVQAILKGKKRVLAHHGHRHRQDRRGLPDLLEALD